MIMFFSAEAGSLNPSTPPCSNTGYQVLLAENGFVAASTNSASTASELEGVKGKDFNNGMIIREKRCCGRGSSADVIKTTQVPDRDLDMHLRN